MAEKKSVVGVAQVLASNAFTGAVDLKGVIAFYTKLGSDLNLLDEERLNTVLTAPDLIEAIGLISADASSREGERVSAFGLSAPALAAFGFPSDATALLYGMSPKRDRYIFVVYKGDGKAPAGVVCLNGITEDLLSRRTTQKVVRLTDDVKSLLMAVLATGVHSSYGQPTEDTDTQLVRPYPSTQMAGVFVTVQAEPLALAACYHSVPRGIERVDRSVFSASVLSEDEEAIVLVKSLLPAESSSILTDGSYAGDLAFYSCKGISKFPAIELPAIVSIDKRLSKVCSTHVSLVQGGREMAVTSSDDYAKIASLVFTTPGTNVADSYLLRDDQLDSFTEAVMTAVVNAKSSPVLVVRDQAMSATLGTTVRLSIKPNTNFVSLASKREE